MRSDLPNCPDCATPVGQAHHPGCDIERCPECGVQRLGCGCDTDRADLPWTGIWPGAAECQARDWYVSMNPGRGWVACSADRPGATEDLNRLYATCRWDPSAQTWTERPARNTP